MSADPMICGTYVKTGCERPITCDACCCCAAHCRCCKRDPRIDPKPGDVCKTEYGRIWTVKCMSRRAILSALETLLWVDVDEEREWQGTLCGWRNVVAKAEVIHAAD